jgi:hypothetical protein
MSNIARVVLVIFLITTLGFAQNSGVARYAGKVREFVWRNPTVYIVFDVKQSDGTFDEYRLTCGTPTDALRLGLKQNSVKQGDTLVVEVNEDRTSRSYGQAIATLPDGRKVRDCRLE